MSATISDDTFNLIVTEEDSGQAYVLYRLSYGLAGACVYRRECGTGRSRRLEVIAGKSQPRLPFARLKLAAG
jgi:hypothetical protein